MRFAFYGRVSTEDQQDPTSSKGWQMSRAVALIAPHGGEVVAEFFDVGQSRSLPWKRRPEAAALLASLSDPDRGFGAVVIGEPARAFSGNQFGLTFPVFTHHGVDLWVPEIGGRIDPGSDAHDLVMNLYGGMSKGERNRIKIRVRSAQAAQAVEGRFLGGRPPYGFQLADVGPHPNPSKAADGKRLHQLELDPATAPIVRRIFAEYIAGAGFYAIAECLTRDGIPSPSGHDPARNRHRQSSHGAWGKSAVRAILRNPRYTGRQVWNKQRRDEVLIDVQDVALGHETKLRWNDPADWIWSTEQVHEAIISPEEFALAQSIATSSRGARSERKRVTAQRRYALSGLVRCGLCGRKMQGSHSHGLARYRCRFATEYALAAGVDHPKQLYIREDRILPGLDAWIASVFDEDSIDQTCATLAAAQLADDATTARSEAARRKIADCDDRLTKYRAALDAGADPLTVAGWMRDVQAERAAAERVLGAETPAAAHLSPAQIKTLIQGIGDAVRMIGGADTALKARLYGDLGITLTYQPERAVVLVEARPWTSVCVGGGT